MTVVLILGFAAIAGAVLWFNYQAVKKRREEFAAAAAEMNWTWTQRDDRWTRAWNDGPFNRGDNRQAENVLTGEWDGRHMVAFDYRYDTHTTDSDGKRSTTTHRHSVVALRTTAQFPDLVLAPEGMFSRAFGKMFGNDINFEWEEFNRAFTVKSPDRKFASDVLHQRMQEYLMQFPRTGWMMQGDWIILCTTGQHSIPQVKNTLGILDGVVDRIPDHVWADHGAVDPGADNRQI